MKIIQKVMFHYKRKFLIKRFSLLFFIILINAVLLLNLNQGNQLIAQEKSKEKPLLPNRLRYITAQFEIIFSNKSTEIDIQKLFIDKNDLQTLGLPDQKIEKIVKIMDSKRNEFVTKIQTYSKKSAGATHTIKGIEIGDAEYLRFLGAKEILALKGVTMIFLKIDSNKKQSEIIIEIPAILLLNNKWKISEVSYIGKNLGFNSKK